VEDVLAGRRPHDIHRLKDWVGIIGFCFATTGLFLRSWAAGIIHKTKALATSGPYAACRNPLYVGSLLLTTGIFIIIGCWKNIAAMMLLILFIYLPKIRQEEQHLENIFGDEWRRYAGRTPALAPKFRVSYQSSWSKLQWLQNKEYNAFITGLLSLFILEAWHELMRG
jgi:protein-S-isoprenylcysteine O-methyltransferase Ste14